MTYPLQFAAGALINTAGSGNDFVGGTNGYGNVEFNGLPSLSNGYIVDGLETNDPLTNLNSGLVDQPGAGLEFDRGSDREHGLLCGGSRALWSLASQLRHQVGTNQMHGNLYELWDGSKFSADDFLRTRRRATTSRAPR